MPKPIKQFNELNVSELQDVANAFSVDFEPGSNKAAKISELAENGVTVAMWNAATGAEEEEVQTVDAAILPVGGPQLNHTDHTHVAAPVVEEPKKEKVLIKMTRFNNTYYIRGYLFKRSHPFQLVEEEDADYLCTVDGGFQMATPSEAREFYS